MGFKRKRSIDQSPLSVSSWTASTPEAQSPTPLPHDMDTVMDLDISSRLDTDFRKRWESRRERLHSDIGSRTRKRFRDNRPDERAIHESTINKLFSAQRNHPHASPVMSESHPSVVQHAPTVQKSTLHSFWKLPAPPVQAPAMQVQHDQAAPANWEAPRCDDCDAPLQHDSNAMDVDMDFDGSGSDSQFACHDCGRKICGTCAVVSNSRHCLQCATTSRDSGRWW
ncbi:hypothetical protein BDV96DRAFT_501234 [Lophiotrema nucula]|uniref:Uncharacterized protein n=1 Tax=Lophiotrema nucula TaxID=690887 RepID=A0A6A5YT45_9PLEO|nr:hypothetical protein BDV96DRAFT_501234 [Lophiotrema nucula]